MSLLNGERVLWMMMSLGRTRIEITGGKMTTLRVGEPREVHGLKEGFGDFQCPEMRLIRLLRRSRAAFTLLPVPIRVTDTRLIALSTQVIRPAVDTTGIHGLYDIEEQKLSDINYTRASGRSSLLLAVPTPATPCS